MTALSSQSASRFILERYRELLPVTDETPLVTLGEGGTPLVRSRVLEGELGVGALYFKLESTNPTGSFKDRGMVLAVAKAVEAGADAVICASTGNTSASASAYAARHGLRAYVVVPAKAIAAGKLAQAVAHGGEIVALDGSFDDALQIVRELAERHPVALVNSVNPDRIEGQKTAAVEVVDELGDAPHVTCIPVGNAGNITAYWRGFDEYFHLERSSRRPAMWGFQAAGAAPLVSGERVAHPETVATAIRIGNPASWAGAIEARDASGGTITAITDEEIVDTYRRLARDEGVFCEPASAASVAGLRREVAEGAELSGQTVVCIITGSGLKDPDIALEIPGTRHDVAAEVRSVEAALGWS
jgi:threonine synthase